MAKQKPQFKNRIIEQGTKRADQFTANPMNPRKHPAKQRKAVEASLDKFGWLAPVIMFSDGVLLDGHERIWQALQRGDDTQVPYVMLDIESTHPDASLALATFDYMTYLAEYDNQILDDLLKEASNDDAMLNELMAEMAEKYLDLEDQPDNYTRKIDIPIYEPSNTKPQVSQLYDDKRTKELIEAIENEPSLTDDERLFLKIASQRHTVFNFSKIADFYAHSSESVQRLMEDNALVIIDFNRAIELGYVRLTKEIAELIEDESHG